MGFWKVTLINHVSSSTTLKSIMNTPVLSAVFTFLLLTGSSPDSHAQHRISKTINSNWDFHKGDLPSASHADVDWEKVSIPHTWNTLDVMDDEPGYYRGVGLYKKTLFIPSSWQGKDIYLYFEGAAQVAEVFVNGKQVGTHTGSYTFFSFPISQYLEFSTEGNAPNELLVKVDNSHDEDIPPLSADFTFFGGLYRDVYLKAVDKVHFDMDNYASSGVFIRTPSVSADAAAVSVNGAFVNQSDIPRSVVVTHTIVDADGKTIAVQKNGFTAAAGEKIAFEQDFSNIANPILWSIEHPYLYKVVSTLMDADSGIPLDEINNPLGFRWFSFDAAEGFFLNGKHVKLIGASRHQDFKNMGNALTDAMHLRDVELLKEMGGNFLRIAHYPQDPAVIEACDRLGILTSVETPIVNRITESEAFAHNAKLMHLEMIRQNYNHPSLIIWAYMNEVLLRPRYEKDSPEQEKYFDTIAKLAEELEDLTHREDPSRYTLIPNHGAFELYNRVRLTEIPQLVGWNLYQGWYGGGLDGFAAYLDKHHGELPHKPLLVTEYGADADNRLHSFDPERFDKTVEYTTSYHEVYLTAMLERPFVAVGMIWNLAEFNSEERAETVPHVNNKGILTLDRKPKDAYRFYQANLLKVPYIQIGSKEWVLRGGFAVSDEDMYCVQPVQVFSNLPEVSFEVNGKSIGTSKPKNGIAVFDVPFQHGLNRLSVVGSSDGQLEVRDHAEIRFQLLPRDLRSKVLPFEQINVSLGDPRYFFDELNHESWLPEKAYEPGSWGYVGGEVFKMAKKGRQTYGSDKNILGTELDPVFATQRTGIEQFRFDVPDGDYELTLHFVELLSSIQKEELVYNLSTDKAQDDGFEERVFDVAVNGIAFLTNLGNAEELVPERAVSSKIRLLVKDNEGIVIRFCPVKGEAILNGVQLRRVR